MELGLGGIAKGYGIDQAAVVLKQRGYHQFVIDGGGDILVGESVNGQTPEHWHYSSPDVQDHLCYGYRSE